MKIASLFLSKLSPGDIGMSVWDYALITESLVLTISSLVATYVIVLVQMTPSEQQLSILLNNSYSVHF